jgi:putative membrane protein
MKEILLQDDIKIVETRLKEFELNTGCELLLIHSKQCDEYPGATWRFGVLSSFLITFLFSLFFEFHHAYLWPLSMFIMTALMVWVGHFNWAKKFALSDLEVKRECMEKAIEYFHSLGTSKVSHKVTAMIMVSVLERNITVLVDEKLKSKISNAELDELVHIMQINFKKGKMSLGFVQSIEALEQKILKDFNGKVSDMNPSELKDQIIFT